MSWISALELGLERPAEEPTAPPRLVPGWAIRDQFPVLERSIHGRPLTYLDTAATSLKPTTVIDAQAAHYRHHDGAAHRGLHTLADEATEAYEQARARVARWIGAPALEGVVFTRSTTAAFNLLARGVEPQLDAGDEILLTEMEHHANLVPWIQLSQRTGAVLRHIPITATDELHLDALGELLSHRTKIVSLMHVSNVLGTINPVAEIAEAAHRVGAKVFVDAAQSVGHLPVDVAALGVDALAFSAHKIYGPAGLGVLVATPNLLGSLAPLEGGGHMISEVELDRVRWAPVPERFEAGTANVPAAVGLAAALDLLEQTGQASIQAHEQLVAHYAWQRLRDLGGLRLLGPGDTLDRGSLLAFHDAQVHPHDMATLLDQRGVAVRAGHHCAQPLHRKLGLTATTRASFGVYSTFDDVDALVEAIRFARSVLS